MKPSVYLETTIISYLIARPSRDLIMMANIQETRDWWELAVDRYDLFVSLPVISEISKGDSDAARKRMELVAGFPRLKVTAEANELADRFLKEIPLPDKAQLDALHLAIACVHGVDFLVTWNCRHLANAQLRNRIESVCHDAGYPYYLYAVRADGAFAMMEHTFVYTDTVVEEIRRIRDEYSERFNGDLSAIVAEMRREHPDIVEVTRPPRKSTGRPQPKRRAPNPECLTHERTTP